MSLLYIFPYIVKPYQLNDAGNNTPADSAQTLTSGESTAINNSGTPYSTNVFNMLSNISPKSSLQQMQDEVSGLTE